MISSQRRLCNVRHRVPFQPELGKSEQPNIKQAKRRFGHAVFEIERTDCRKYLWRRRPASHSVPWSAGRPRSRSLKSMSTASGADGFSACHLGIIDTIAGCVRRPDPVSTPLIALPRIIREWRRVRVARRCESYAFASLRLPTKMLTLRVPLPMKALPDRRAPSCQSSHGPTMPGSPDPS